MTVTQPNIQDKNLKMLEADAQPNELLTKKMDFKQQIECFQKLIDNFHIAEFLRKDRCGALCDKYHLVIVFQFFLRAEFKEEDYTPRNFFLALTLSHDLYDESKILKQIIMAYYLSRNDGFRDKSKVAFHWDKLYLFRRMQYKGLVERKICKKICQLVLHQAFDKSRRELHSGSVTNKKLCDKCLCPTNERIKQSKQMKTKDKNEEQSDRREVQSQKLEHIPEHKAKKPKKDIIGNAKSNFFRDHQPELFAVDKETITHPAC